MSIEEGLRQKAARLLKGITPPWRITNRYPMFVGLGIALQDGNDIDHEDRTGDVFGLYLGREFELPADKLEFIAAAPTLVTGLLLALDKAEQEKAQAERENALLRECSRQDDELVEAVTAERDELKTNLAQAERERDEAYQKMRETVPCPVCRWPMAPDTSYQICPCCSFQFNYNAPDGYPWNGQWWADMERRPAILEAAEARLRSLEGREPQETERT